MDRARLLIAACLALSGCAVPFLSSGGVAGPPAPFPECEAETYAFVGETSLAAIGLGANMGPEGRRTGSVWVTYEPVDPEVWGGPGGQGPPPGRVACIEFADGSGMSMPIDAAWQPPGTGLDLDAAGGTSPLVGLAALGGVAVLVAVSWLAFRRTPPE